MSNRLNRFYTYAYLREEGTPYYIGKGSGYRITYPRRTINKPPIKNRILFLKQNLTEEESFKHEKYMIAVLGRKDMGTGILRNLTEGGEGCSGWTPSKETREKISKKLKGRVPWNNGIKRTEETKRKQSESMRGKPSYWKNKKLPEEMIEKQRNTKQKNGTAKGKNNPRSKKWEITFECGRVEIVESLQTWAIENGYKATSIRNLYNGNGVKNYKDIIKVVWLHCANLTSGT